MDRKQGSIEIFCCYARKDQPLLLELKTHLMSLQREGLITLWADVDIDAGAEWEKEIHLHLNTARIILLLISSDFLVSQYCYSVEMQQAMERHEQGETRVVPIILRHVSWQGAPFGKLQVLPTGAIPVIDPRWHSQDQAFSQVVEGIRHIVTPFRIKQYLARGESEYDQGNIGASLSTYERIIGALDPRCAAAYLGKGRALEALGREEEALTAYNQALGLDENIDAQVYYRKGVIFEHLARQAYSAARQHGYTKEDSNALPEPAASLGASSQKPDLANRRIRFKVFGNQEEAYHHLFHMVQRYGAKEASLFQYSGQTSLSLLRMLLRVGAEVTVFLQHENRAASIGSQFQAERIRRTMRDLWSDLGSDLSEPDKLKLYKYDPPSSMSALKIDHRVICMGWYTYEYKGRREHPSFSNDTVEVSGHDRAAVVLWKETEEFQVLDETFSVVEGTDWFEALDRTLSLLEQDYREHAEVVPL